MAGGGAGADFVPKSRRAGDLPDRSGWRHLVINVVAAKALGLDVPDKLLAFADEVIE